MGKTHLLHAIGNGILNADPRKKIVCASSEKITLDFISSMQKNKTVEFSKTYRNADVLRLMTSNSFRVKNKHKNSFFIHLLVFKSGKQGVSQQMNTPEKWSAFKNGLLSRDLNQASLIDIRGRLRDLVAIVTWKS